MNNLACNWGGVHIWVEAWVDYIPSRCAKNKVGDSWIALDASFKQYQFNKALPISKVIPIDSEALLEQIVQSAHINKVDDSISNIDENLIAGKLTQLDAYIQQVNPEATISDIVGKQIIVEQYNPMLASGLPYRVISATKGVAELSNKLRHFLNFKLYGSVLDRANDSPILNYQISLPQLSRQRISFGYEPSTKADRTVIDSALENHQRRFPAYLVKMTPILKVEDQIVGGLGSFTVGSEQILTVEINTPWYAQPRDYAVSSGDFWVLGVNATGLTPQIYQNRLKSHELTVSDRPDFAAEMYHQIMLGYWAELNTHEDLLGNIQSVKHYQLPSHGFAGAPVDVTFNFGIPRWASYKTRMLDVKENRKTLIHLGQETDTARAYLLQIGMLASYLESGIYDQAFLTMPGFSMSAVTALKKANELGIPIFRITAANLSTALQKLTVDDEVKNDISSAAHAGLEILVSRDPVSVANFKGVGYLITDPKTGAGSYRISGAREGDNSPAPESVYPLVQIPATAIIGIMMGSLMRSSGARLVASEQGILMGISIPDSVPSNQTASNTFALITVVSLLLSAFQAAIDEMYPKKEKPQIFRKYAEEWLTIENLVTQAIRESRDPDHSFGQGVVYLALHDKDDPVLRPDFLGNFPVNCPPNGSQPKDIAEAYQLPYPNSDPDSKLAESFLDVEATRENILTSESKINERKVTEVIVTNPLVWAPGKSKAYRYLLFGPTIIGVGLNRVCF